MGSSGSSSSSTRETSLSIEQAKILKSRQADYEKYFLPELLDMLNETKTDSFQNVARDTQQAQIAKSYQASADKLSQQMAQRGLSGSGVESLALSRMGSDRAYATSELAQKAKMANEQKRMNLLQMGGTLSPQPTTAAPLSQSSKQSSFSLL